jgi:hypothetical protein
MGVAAVGSAFAGGASARKGAKIAAANARQQAIYRNERYLQQVEYQQKVGEWQQETYQTTADSIQNSLTGQYGAMLERLNQQRDQAMEQAAAYDTSQQQGLSQLRAARAGDLGSGNSLRLLQQQYEAASAKQKYTSYRNLDAQVRQGMRDMLAMQAQAQGQLNAAMPAPLAPIDPAQPVGNVHHPSMLPYVLQGVTGVLGATAHAQRMGAFDTSPTSSFSAAGPNVAPGTNGVYAPGMAPAPTPTVPYYLSRY